MSETYSVYIHRKIFNNYAIYYSNGRYIENSDTMPDSAFDKFECSRLTNKKINEKMTEGITLKEILKDYSESIQTWRDEILNCNSLQKKFDFFNTFIKDDGIRFQNNNDSNILRFFKLYSSKIHKASEWEPVTWNEYLWYEKTYNGGLMKCKVGDYNCLGYDFKMSYPTILASEITIFDKQRDFYFPVSEGKSKYIFKLPKKPEMGLYRVKIECDDEDFLFIFNLKCDTNVYTHYDIEFCNEVKKQFKIKIKLILDGEPNALIYEGWKNRINGKHVFKPWYDTLTELKEELPNNGLIKMLSSSIWGYLSKINKRYYGDEELDEKEIEFDYYDDKDLKYLCLKEKDNKSGGVDYQLIKKTKPYSNNYRLKPFITSFQRILIAEIAIEIGIKKIVRINTDNITFDRKLLSRKDLLVLANISPTFIEEEKTTGNFHIENINKFTPI